MICRRCRAARRPVSTGLKGAPVVKAGGLLLTAMALLVASGCAKRVAPAKVEAPSGPAEASSLRMSRTFGCTELAMLMVSSRVRPYRPLLMTLALMMTRSAFVASDDPPSCLHCCLLGDCVFDFRVKGVPKSRAAQEGPFRQGFKEPVGGARATANRPPAPVEELDLHTMAPACAEQGLLG